MANLQSVRDNGLSISLSALAGDSSLVQDIQEHLAKIGFIDLGGVSLGVLSAETKAAIEKFQLIAGVDSPNITASFAKKLINITQPKIAPLPPAAITISLTGHVGAGGGRGNNPADVLAIKNRLADLGFSVSANSTVDSKTIKAIKLFQAIINDINSDNTKNAIDIFSQEGNIDGRVDVNGKTHKALEKATAPRWLEMSAGSIQEGFLNNDDLQGDDSDFGTNWMLETIQSASIIYRNKHLKNNPNAALIAINDVSKMSAGKHPQHATHQVEMCCDIRLPHKDGASEQITFQDSQYDRSAMRAILKAFREQSQHKIRRIFFNDFTLITEGLCQTASGHDNHAHIDIQLPSL